MQSGSCRPEPAEYDTRLPYAAITHGVATGTAASTLGAGFASADQGQRVVIMTILRQLWDTDLTIAAQELKLAGLGAPDAASLRRRVIEAVNSSPPGDLAAIERALKDKSPASSRWTA